MYDRIGINDGVGATNTINDLEYYTLIWETCAKIYNLLVDHCGPHATDALVFTDNPNNLKDKHYAIFTKDGINIVRSIEFISPIQKHIQSLIAYIGERVDSLAHDGTTTSMMLFTKLVEVYFDKIIKAVENGEIINRRQMKQDIQQRLTSLMQEFETQVITLERFIKDFEFSEKEAIRFIAYHQAMLASKGDVELSAAIAEVLETLPTELYGLFGYTQSGIETEQRFNVTRDDFDFKVPVLSNIDDYNYNMNTEFLSEDCDLIISEDGLMKGNMALEVIVNHIGKYRAEAYPIILDNGNVEIDSANVTYDEVIQKAEPAIYDVSIVVSPGQESPLLKPAVEEIREIRLKQDRCHRNNIADLTPGTILRLEDQKNPLENGNWVYHGPNQPLTRPEKKRDLVLIAKSIDATLMDHINKLNQRMINKITVFTVSTPNAYASKCTSLQAVVNMAGKYSPNDYLEDPSNRSYVIEGVKIHFKHRYVYISNLYKKDGTRYHPYYNNPGMFLPYDQMVTEIKDHLAQHASGRLRIESAQDKYRYEDYVEIFRRMICAEVRNLQIAGMRHDALHDRDILQDSFGAVLSSLENGFVLDAYLKLFYLETKHYTINNPNSSPILFTAFLNILMASHRLPSSDIIEKLTNYPEKSNLSYLFYPIGDRVLYFNKDSLQQKEGDIVPAFYDGDALTSSYLVMQPADTYRELFKRLADLLPKLINSNRAIVPGTVNENGLK